MLKHSEFIEFIKREYNKFHGNRNEIFNSLNIFYALEFNVRNGETLTKIIFHKDWNYFIVSWTFHAEESLNGKAVAWSMPREVPLEEFNQQFTGLRDTLFSNPYIVKVEISQEETRV